MTELRLYIGQIRKIFRKKSKENLTQALFFHCLCLPGLLDGGSLADCQCLGLAPMKGLLAVFFGHCFAHQTAQGLDVQLKLSVGHFPRWHTTYTRTHRLRRVVRQNARVRRCFH